MIDFKRVFLKTVLLTFPWVLGLLFYFVYRKPILLFQELNLDTMQLKFILPTFISNTFPSFLSSFGTMWLLFSFFKSIKRKYLLLTTFLSGLIVEIMQNFNTRSTFDFNDCIAIFVGLIIANQLLDSCKIGNAL